MAFALAMGAGVTAHAQSDSIVNVAFGTKPQEDVITATSSVNVADLMKKSYATSSLDESLRSLIGGYNGGKSGCAPPRPANRRRNCWSSFWMIRTR